MTFEIKGYLDEPITVQPKVELYTVHDFMGKELPGLAIVLDTPCLESGQQEEFAVLTKSFGEFIGLKNSAYIDTNNCPFAQQLLDQGIAKDTGLTKSSGFCNYPLWVFDEKFLQEHGGENYSKYLQEYESYMNFGGEEPEEFVEQEGMTMK